MAPRFALAFLNLGASLTVIGARPGYIAALFLSCFVLQSLAQWNDAVAALRRAKPLLPLRSPLLPEYYNRLGIALLKQGGADNRLEPVQEAAGILREGATRYPKHREILANLAEVGPLEH